MAQGASKARRWRVDSRMTADGFTELDPGEVAEAMVEVGTILRRIGGSVLMAADRQQVSEGVFETIGVDIMWESYLPARRQAPPVEAPADVEDFEEAVAQETPAA